MSKARRFLIVDDHPLFMEALEAAIASAYPQARFELAENVDEAVQMLDEAIQPFDLVILDLRMPGKSGFDGLWQIKGTHRKLPVIMISRANDREIIEHARTGGASGFIHKSARRDMIVEAISTVLDGETWFPELEETAEQNVEGDTTPDNNELQARIRSLTPQQFKVLELICAGKLNKQIAYELDVGLTTVKSHTTGILKKLNVHSRTQAVLLVQQIKIHEAGLTEEQDEA